MAWPEGFPRLPAEDWVSQPIGELARKYDTVENHGWYRNLDSTVYDIVDALGDQGILLDYSGGTGILADRLFKRWGDAPRRVLIVDSSPKFLRLAVEKFADEPRVAFRRIHYLREEKRLQTLDECLDASLRERGVDVLSSTNAIHPYYNLEETLASWQRALRPGGRLFIQSGNIDNPARAEGEWIIDNTVHAIHRKALELVQAGAFPDYREGTDDLIRMAEYDKLRAKYFLPVRPLEHYLGALGRAGFEQITHRQARIEASVDDWYDFLSAYHAGVLGWVGGVARIDGQEPTAAQVQDRLALLRQAIEAVFEGDADFACSWTYISASRSE